MSDFISAFFKKERHEISVVDITKLFETPQNETPILEFKSGEASPEKLYKEITALHNTDGGLLILGAPRESDKRCQGELVPSKLKKLALLQGIGSNIVPPPIGIYIHALEHGDGYIHLIDVPKSSNPPHQYAGCYYVRFDEESKPAPHGFVQAMFQKRKVPLFESSVDFKNRNGGVVLDITIENTSPIPAQKVYYALGFTGGIEKVTPIHRSDISFISSSNTTDGAISTHSVSSKFTGIFVRGMKVKALIVVKMNPNAHFLLVSIDTWSKNTEMSSTYRTYQIVKESLESERRDVGRIEYEETFHSFIQREANAQFDTTHF